MKNTFLLSLALMAGMPTLAQAQHGESNLVVSAAQQVVEEIGLERLTSTTNALRPIDARNLSVLRQTGEGNHATIEQVSQSSAPNQALIVQAGNANITDFYQNGSSNLASLEFQGDSNTGSVYQKGSNNTFDGRVKGSGNDVDVVQKGSGNSSHLDVVSDNTSYPIGRSYPVLQVGNNNQLTQREAAGTSAPLGYGVEMRGNGIRLTIEQGKAHP